MTAILGFYMEDVDFVDCTAGRLNVAEAEHRAGFSRCSMAAGSSSGGYNGWASTAAFKGGAVTSCWFHFYATKGSTGTLITLAGLVKYGTNMAGLYIKYDSGNIILQTRSSAGALATLETATAVGWSNQYDMHLENYGATATVNIYAGGTEPILTFNGDVRISGLTNVDAVGIQGDAYQSRFLLSEFIVGDNDTDTRPLIVKTYSLDADGDTNNWTGSRTDIDEIIYNDTDNIYSNTAAQDFLGNCVVTPAGDFSVLAFKTVARACKTADASIGSLALGVKTNSTIYVDGTPDELSLNWGTYEHTYTNNPATAVPFTLSELDAIQLAARSAA